MDILEIICGVVIGNGITIFALVSAMESIRAESEKRNTPVNAVSESVYMGSGLMEWWRANYPKRAVSA